MRCYISLCGQLCHCEFVIPALNPAMLPQISLTSRSKVNCPILGISADLKANVLPSTHDLLKYHLYLKEESLKKKPRGLLSRMVDEVMQGWEASSLPTLSKPRVTELKRKRLDQYFH